MGGGSKEVPASSEGEEEMRGVQRRYDLDWIRIFVVLHLVPFHMLLAIRELGGGISRAVLTFPGIFASPWHMHIMFLISGAATYYALRFRSIREYALNRLKRLFVPLLFCLVVIIPVHHFYWRFPPLSPIVEESHYRNFLIFYLKDYPGLLWANGTFFLGNLWFVYYLFIFSLICLPVFVYFEGEGGRRFAIRLADILERRGMIFALGVPLAVGVAILSMIQRSRKGWDIVHDLTNSFQYISCFIYGYLISSDERVWEAVERQWKVSGVALVVLNLILLVLGSRMGRVVVAGIRGFGSWLWILLILGLGRGFLNFENRFLRYMREAFYPFFIIHQPVILALGYYTQGWGVPVLIRALTVGVLTTVLTLLIYDLCVKRTNVTRFLFGLRPLPKASSPRSGFSSARNT